MSNRHIGGRVLDTSAEFAVDDVRGPPTSGAVAPPTWVKSPVKKDVKPPIKELDEHRLAQRQKQIDYGKNTLGYQRYLQLVPKHKRQKGDPQTPDMYINNSKRAFEGQIKVWRRQLHKYDQEGDEEAGPTAVLSYAERARLAAANREGDVAVSAVASSPTNSSRSRGSLDGYLPPAAVASDASGRKRPFKRAFDQLAAENPQPSKLLTSPAGPRPGAPQSAPPATTDAGPAPSTGRCMDPPGPAPGAAAARAGSNLGAASGVPKAPATAPPAAPRGAGGTTAATTAMGSPPGSAKKRGAAGGEDMFREWEEEEYAGLEQWDDEEVDVQL